MGSPEADLAFQYKFTQAGVEDLMPCPPHPPLLSGIDRHSASVLVGTASPDLVIADTPLTGTLPSIWSINQRIISLRIANTQISGTLPNSWAGMRNLTQLDISQNSITGRLPPWWAATVSGPSSIGAWPVWDGSSDDLWMYGGLKALNLSYNLLNGGLPGSWCEAFGTSNS